MAAIYRTVLEPVEKYLMFTIGALLIALAILFAWSPRVLMYPVVFMFVWMACALFYKGFKLHRRKR